LFIPHIIFLYIYFFCLLQKYQAFTVILNISNRTKNKILKEKKTQKKKSNKQTAKTIYDEEKKEIQIKKQKKSFNRSNNVILFNIC